jgi:O-antigen/teichoic acid export membrane protein
VTQALLRLVRQSGAYALGNVAVKSSGLILAAFYLDPTYLPKADFGYLSQLDALARVVLLVGSLGLPLGLIKFAVAAGPPAPDGGEAPDVAQGTLPATALTLSAACGALLCVLGWAAAPWLAAALLDEAARAPLVRLLALYVGFKTVADVGYAELRARERPGLFVGAVMVEWGVLIVGVVYFLAAAGEGLEGVLKGYTLSAMAVGVVLGGWVARQAVGRGRRGRVDLGLARRLVAFGAPLVASGLAARFLAVGDRFLIDWLLGPAPVAEYEWASKIGGVLNMFFVQSFQLAFTVIGLKALAADERAAPLHRGVFRHFAVWTAWAALGLTLLTPDGTRLLTDEPGYADVEPLVLLIALGFLMNGLYFIAVNVLYAGGRTRTVAWSVAAAAALNAGLNLALIPFLGLVGAALATFLAYGALAFWTAWIAERDIHAGYPWRVLASALLIVAGLWVLAQGSVAWSVGARLAWRAGLLALYPVLVVAAGLYRPAELRHYVGVARGLWRREHDG